MAWADKYKPKDTNPIDTLLGKKEHWTESQVVRWKCEHGHPHNGRAEEPEPWKSYRRRSCPRCSHCFGCGWVTSYTKRGRPIAYTAAGAPIHPCECTQPKVEVEVVGEPKEQYTSQGKDAAAGAVAEDYPTPF